MDRWLDDLANCGACGRTCAAGTQSCTAGHCTGVPVGGSCGTSGDSCAADSACRTNTGSGTPSSMCCPTLGNTTNCNGSCVNTQTDMNHCGGHSGVCPPGGPCNLCPGPTSGTGTATCSGGSCGICCGAATPMLCDGACVNTQTDNNHCGCCCNACSFGTTYWNGACACPTGQTLCPGGAGVICTNTLTDANNCGTCLNKCTPGNICQNGSCVAACNDSTNPAVRTCQGTCTNTATDPQNCGGCGIVCQTGSCSNGRCSGTGTCSNNVRDNGETDVDCGGPTNCPRCQPGQHCLVNSDCTTGLCIHRKVPCAKPGVAGPGTNTPGTCAGGSGNAAGFCGGPCTVIPGAGTGCLDGSVCSTSLVCDCSGTIGGCGQPCGLDAPGEGPCPNSPNGTCVGGICRCSSGS